MFPFSAFSLVLFAAATSGSAPFILHERQGGTPPDFMRTGTPDPGELLTLRLNLASSNLAGLANALDVASNPSSSTFREWLSKEEVESFAQPTQETTDAVNAWLASHGVSSASPLTAAGDWVKFQVPVQTAEQMLNADFGVFTHTASGQTTIRSLEYSLPANLQAHVKLVHPVTSFAGPIHVGPLRVTPVTRPASDAVAASCNDTITPTCLQSMYNIPSKAATGAKGGGIGVTGMFDEWAYKPDIAAFLEQYRPDLSSSTTFALTTLDGGANTQVSYEAGQEADLDIEYTVGVASKVAVTFVSVGENWQDGDDEGFLDVINALLKETTPPAVLTTSYGFSEESALSEALTVALCNSYMQLTARGVSILFASGDGGVGSTPGVDCDATAFAPSFPTCPYVTLVGATSNVPETGASLSAGGFSNYFATPSYQTSAVDAYLKLLGTEYVGAYNASGRAYPDVSAQGQNVATVYFDEIQLVDGTSASSPIWASVIGLLNDELLSNKKSTLGFLNPWLYDNPGMFNDITTGSNPGCNTNGFSASTGWDPVTGLGTPNYTAMRIAAGL